MMQLAKEFQARFIGSSSPPHGLYAPSLDRVSLGFHGTERESSRIEIFSEGSITATLEFLKRSLCPRLFSIANPPSLLVTRNALGGFPELSTSGDSITSRHPPPGTDGMRTVTIWGEVVPTKSSANHGKSGIALQR